MSPKRKTKPVVREDTTIQSPEAQRAVKESTTGIAKAVLESSEAEARRPGKKPAEGGEDSQARGKPPPDTYPGKQEFRPTH